MVFTDERSHFIGPGGIGCGVGDGFTAIEGADFSDVFFGDAGIGDAAIVVESEHDDDAAGFGGDGGGVEQVVPAFLDGGDERGVVGAEGGGFGIDGDDAAARGAAVLLHLGCDLDALA